MQRVHLNNLGQLVNKDIGFFWTGPEVVSTEIPIESIRELRKVIKRKPVIWDNIHSNDYDILQIFFGPYTGKMLELKKRNIRYYKQPQLPILGQLQSIENAGYV